MKWLKIEKKEQRTKVLTVRISNTTHKKLVSLLKYLKKTERELSQADLIEHMINLAHQEMEAEMTKKKK